MRLVELRLHHADPRERGRAYGTALGVEVLASTERYRDAFATLGVPAAVVDEVAVGCGDAMRSWAPEQWRELEGLAEASGASVDRLLALTARTEVLAHADAEAVECSTVVALREGASPASLQTWDWHGDLAPVGALLELRLPHRVVRTFAEVGMLGKIGVAAGVGVHLNILQHASDRSRAGVPVHVVARRILDEAHGLDDAIALARSAELCASTVLTVIEAASGGGSGRAACIELAPAGVGVVHPDDGFLAHANHFLDPALAPGDATRPTSTTHARLAHALGRRSEIATASDAPGMAAALCGPAGGDAPVCVREVPGAPLAERWSTLLTASLDVDATAIDWVAGPPSAMDAASVRRFGPSRRAATAGARPARGGEESDAQR